MDDLEKNLFDSEEFKELEKNFLQGLSVDVRGWDSYQNLIYYIYNHRA